MGDAADDFNSPELTLKRKIGRPKGTKNHLTFSAEQLKTKSQELHARKAAKRLAWSEGVMDSTGVASRTRLSLSSPLPFNSPDLEPPERIGRILSEEVAAFAIRITCI